MAEKILVVDDEPLILTAVERALSKIGYAIIKVQNMVELDAALGEAPFDLLITDIYIQGGTVDGIIAKVSACSPSLKIIRMSGSINRYDVPNFLEKPFSIESLRRRVKEILDEPS